jgi:hypothetical protein
MLYLELLKLLYDLVAAGFSLRSNSESKPIVVRITQPKNCGYALVPLSLFFFEENPGKGGLCQENRPDPMFYVLNCRHKANHPQSVIAKTCDTNHDFCPHNPKNQKLSS